MRELMIALIACCSTIIHALDYSIHIKGRLECLGETNKGVYLMFYTREGGKLKFTEYTTYASGDFDITANRTTNAEKVKFLVDFQHECAFSVQLCAQHFNRTIKDEYVAQNQKTAKLYDLGTIEMHEEWNDVKCDDSLLED